MKKIIAALTAALAALALAGSARAQAAPSLDPVKVAEIVRLSALLDELPQKAYPITATNADNFLSNWATEILPWFAYEGVSDPAIPPKDISFYFGPFGPKEYIDGYVFHILGLSACEQIGVAPNPFDGELTPVAGPIWLNGRYINSASPWYQRPDLVSVLTHELGHSQGICAGPSPYVESSTQIATMEVLAAMANSGNDSVLLSLLFEYRGIVQGALKFEAMRDGLADQYEQLVASVDHYSAREAAIRDASRRFWNKSDEGRAELRGILYRYELVPYVKIQWGLKYGSLRASATQGRLTAPQMLVPLGTDFKLDDLAYFLANAEVRVEEVAAASRS